MRLISKAWPSSSVFLIRNILLFLKGSLFTDWILKISCHGKLVTQTIQNHYTLYPMSIHDKEYILFESKNSIRAAIWAALFLS